jgi:Short C-terminal domain
MGLVGAMARTAVVAGTATAVSNRVSRRQARRWGGQEQYAEPQYAPAPPPPQYAPAPPPLAAPEQLAPPSAEAGDLSAEISRLAELRNQGLLTDDEFNAAKAKLLGI